MSLGKRVYKSPNKHTKEVIKMTAGIYNIHRVLPVL